MALDVSGQWLASASTGAELASLASCACMHSETCWRSAPERQMLFRLVVHTKNGL